MWYLAGLGCFGVVWGVSTDPFRTGNTEMRIQVDFAKSTLNSEICLKYILFSLIMYILLQIIIRNNILNSEI